MLPSYEWKKSVNRWNTISRKHKMYPVIALLSRSIKQILSFYFKKLLWSSSCWASSEGHRWRQNWWRQRNQKAADSSVSVLLNKSSSHKTKGDKVKMKFISFFLVFFFKLFYIKLFVKQLFYSHGRVTPERCTNPFLKALIRKKLCFFCFFFSWCFLNPSVYSYIIYKETHNK